MPTYSFIDPASGEEYSIEMKWQDLDQYKLDNPDHQQVFKMNIGDPVGLGITRPPSDFSKYVMGKVAQMPGANKSAIERRWPIKKEV